LPDLMRLARGLKPQLTLTETFGPAYFARRRKSDRFPVPHVGKIRATVRDAILAPGLLDARRISSVQRSC
jgi:hypothetical protein